MEALDAKYMDAMEAGASQEEMEQSSMKWTCN